MPLPEDLPEPLKDEARAVAESVGVELEEENDSE